MARQIAARMATIAAIHACTRLDFGHFSTIQSCSQTLARQRKKNGRTNSKLIVEFQTEAIHGGRFIIRALRMCRIDDGRVFMRTANSINTHFAEQKDAEKQ